MAKHRIGIVGCGGIAHRHVEGYRAVIGNQCEVAAACDPNRETLNTFCERYGVRERFTDARELIRSGAVDAISLLTPPAVRGEVIFPAVEQGIAVLVEKPFANSLAEAIALVRTAERTGAALAVNQQFRFMPEALAAREIIDAGEIGEVRFIAHDAFQNRTRVAGWRAEEERLEISIFSIHLLDRIRWLAGRPPLAVMAATRAWNEAVRGETFTALTVQFEGGAVGTMVSNWHALALPECRLRVDGTAGSLLAVKERAQGDACTLTLQRAGGAIERRDLSREHVFARAIGASMKRLLEARERGVPPPHSGRDNLETMAIVDAAYLSASRGGARVVIAELRRD